MAESIQQKLKRVRKPRVHITYDVETEGARVVKELPFVMGVVGDFSGHPTKELPPLEQRKFVEIDRDNFNDVMKRMTPGLNMRVENTIAGDGSEMGVQLQFNSLDDFAPANIVQQVDPLRKLMETRNQLRDLVAKIDRSADLENILEQVLKNTDDLKKLSAELGVDMGGGSGGGGEASASEGDGQATDNPESGA
jgi:type VI secretion system protein ImpB